MVTVDAPFFHRVVFEFKLCNLVAHGFMTAETEFISCLEQTGFVVGGMGVVALDATPLEYNFVSTLRL